MAQLEAQLRATVFLALQEKPLDSVQGSTPFFRIKERRASCVCSSSRSTLRQPTSSHRPLKVGTLAFLRLTMTFADTGRLVLSLIGDCLDKLGLKASASVFQREVGLPVHAHPPTPPHIPPPPSVQLSSGRSGPVWRRLASEAGPEEPLLAALLRSASGGGVGGKPGLSPSSSEESGKPVGKARAPLQALDTVDEPVSPVRAQSPPPKAQSLLGLPIPCGK